MITITVPYKIFSPYARAQNIPIANSRCYAHETEYGMNGHLLTDLAFRGKKILQSLNIVSTTDHFGEKSNPYSYVCRIEFFPPKINDICQLNCLCHKFLTCFTNIVI